MVQDQGIFGPESLTWKVAQEAVVNLGGARAVLMQLAHPLVATGVGTHSTYMRDPIGRTKRTFTLGLMLTFGSMTTARQAARIINRLHTHVQGELPAEAGAYAQHTPYKARDPELLLWVHATLVDTILLTYSLFVGPLTAEEQEQYYQESKALAPLLGLPTASMPETVGDLHHYVHEMVYSNRLAATPQARQLARQLLFPPIPAVFRPLLHINLQVTCALLPPPVRNIYGLEWGPKRQWLFELSAAQLRTIISRLPPFLHVLPITHGMIQQGAIPFSWLAHPL